MKLVLTTIYAVLFYFATLVLVGGLAYRIYEYFTVKAPLNIAQTPAPVTQSGAAFRVMAEVTFFTSLFKSNKWIWILGYLFHVGLLLALIRHLRYFVDPAYLYEPLWLALSLFQPIGMYAGFAMVAGLAGLWARRFLVDRVRYISSPSDHLMLALLLAIGASGLAMRFVLRTDIVALKNFILGLMRFDWQPLPGDPILLVHLGLVIALMIIFPYSKLLHAPGVFFSPSRAQADNPREKRRIAPWAAKLDRAGD